MIVRRFNVPATASILASFMLGAAPAWGNESQRRDADLASEFDRSIGTIPLGTAPAKGQTLSNGCASTPYDCSFEQRGVTYVVFGNQITAKTQIRDSFLGCSGQAIFECVKGKLRHLANYVLHDDGKYLGFGAPGTDGSDRYYSVRYVDQYHVEVRAMINAI